MSDRMTDPAPVTPASFEPPSSSMSQPSSARRAGWVAPAVQGGIILALFAGTGLLGGWVWWKLWAPAPAGAVYEKQWYPKATEGLLADFAGTGWYVVVALVAGVLLGVLAGLRLDRNEIVTLVAVVVGSALAAWLMMKVGFHFSPPDPQHIADTAKNGTELPGQLELAGSVNLPGHRFDEVVRSPMLAFPIGALAGLAIALFGMSKPHRHHGLSRNPCRVVSRPTHDQRSPRAEGEPHVHHPAAQRTTERPASEQPASEQPASEQPASERATPLGCAR